VELHELSEERNIRMVRRHVGPTCQRLMRRAPASRLGPLLVWVKFDHEISPTARMTTNLDGTVDSTTDSTTSPSRVDGTLVI
jgi:hypothetical protein